MRLKQLKLAGFKSFVDPTVVSFPGQLVAVVGPNGCGKSNIIDAVRWVLGESSAKNLRGGSMADVIFNGSANRKPVGQASVELIFDNSLGRLTGPFASYGEIAVKRMVTKDGESAYFLNGNKCRRRDITDIFLGTGAGAKGYSIIGQGTISALIEAKPEDLRIFLEEAAGVSKYKERRRETIQKIAQTREHLIRVVDISSELEKQVHRLERQAQSARRYLVLKDEEKQCNAEILALKWLGMDKQHQLKTKELQNIILSHEHQQSLLTGLNKERTLLNGELHTVDEACQNTQSVFYSLGTEIARLEAASQQHERDKKRLEQDKQQMQEGWQSANEHLQQHCENLEESKHKTENLAQQLIDLSEYSKKIEIERQESQEKQTQWHKTWQELQSDMNAVKSKLQVTQLKVQHLEQKKGSTEARLKQIYIEQANFSLKELEDKKKDLTEKQGILEEILLRDDLRLKQGKDLLDQANNQFQQAEQQLQRMRDEFHHLNTEYAGLSARHKAAIEKNIHKEQELLDKPKLIDILDVEPKWQSLCDRILNEALHSYVVEDFEEFWSEKPTKLHSGAMALTMQPLAPNNKKYPRLAEKLKGKIPALIPSLECIYLSLDLKQALAWLPSLNEHESVVTLEGCWLGKGWMKWIGAEEQNEAGLLVNKQKLSSLALEVQNLQNKIDETKDIRDELQQKVQESRNAMESLQPALLSSKEALSANLNALKANEQSLLYAEKLRATWNVEQEALQQLLKSTQLELKEKEDECQEVEQQVTHYEQQYDRFLKEKEAWELCLMQHNKDVDTTSNLIRETEMNHHKESIKLQQLNENIARGQEELDKIQERIESFELQRIELESPQKESKIKLEEHLQKYIQVESQWMKDKEQVAQLKLKLSSFEKQIIQQESEIRTVQELMNQLQMQEQELAVRAETIKESLAELGAQTSSILEQIPKEVTLLMREEQLVALVGRIKNLGAINLSAIEEFAAEQERMLYLEQQHQDLSQALTLLEKAIEEIDKETLSRLEHTFNEVNILFKALFPRLFGGGSAQLTLTCDNLLESGIVVMAQPPGKRNSTIHLLSGGEKAMTAVALVFAIFQLNPSPFCMLDEVDAPLDDVNVGRFCELVKEMSQFIQFLFITHNKVTMELADQLIGVTMREPGVSRLVAVDVKEALMAE